jgi:hypothetical protein
VTWQAQVEGDLQDLEYSVRVFGSGTRRILRDPLASGFLYESDTFKTCRTPAEVEQIAAGELAELSGILRLELNAREALRLGAIFKPNPNGGRDTHVRVRGVESQVRMGIPTAVITDAAGNAISSQAPPPRSLVISLIAEGDSAVAKVLRLLSAGDAASWVGLYRIHEVIEADMGGESNLKDQGWGSQGDLKRFKRSANSVQVGGDLSRHGSEATCPPNNPMSLPEAEAYLKYVVQCWLATKGA